MDHIKSNTVKRHFDVIANDYDYWKEKAWYYYKNIRDLYREFVTPGSSVLEIGCGTGNILASLNPSQGVGIDISKEMINRAQKKHHKLIFLVDDATHPKKLNGKYSRVIIPDLAEHVINFQTVINQAHNYIKPNGLLILSSANPLWGSILDIAEKTHFKMPEGPHKWVSLEELKNISIKSGYVVIDSGYRMLIPKYIPMLSEFVNKYIAKFPLFQPLCLIQYLVISPKKK